MKKLILICAIAFIGSTAFSQSLNPLNVGTIDPGDSIVVYYDVTINNGCGCTEIDNQGSVSGSNFATLNTDDPKTAAPGDVTITRLNLAVVALNSVDLSAKWSGNGIAISWATGAENNMLSYAVERSADGIHFTQIGDVPSVNSQSAFTYSYFDASPIKGTNFYRLRMLSSSVAAKYSLTVQVNPKNVRGGFDVFPNPVTGKQLNIQLNDIPDGDYTLLLYNAVGQGVLRTTVHYSGGTLRSTIVLQASISSGVYTVRLQGALQSYGKVVVVE